MPNPTACLMSTHTNPRAALVIAHDLTAADLNLDERTRELWRGLREDAGIMARIAVSTLRHVMYRLQRTDNRSDPVELLAGLIVKLSALGVPEAFFRRLLGFLEEVVDACFAGKPRVAMEELDRADLVLEASENRIQGIRLISHRASPDAKDAEAAALEREIATKKVRARLLRQEARLERAGLLAIAG